MSYHEYKSPHKQDITRKNTHKSQKRREPLAPVDKNLLTIVIFLVIIGFLAIFSATAPKCLREGTNLASYLIKQVIFGAGGLFLMCFFAKMDYKKLEQYNKPVLYTVIFLLFLLEATPLGVTINGAKRWINLGFMQLQPSEFAKPLFCMLLATVFKNNYTFKSLFEDYPLYIGGMIVILGLIFLQPNLSMTIILGLTGLALYIASRGPWLPIGILGGVGLLGILTMLPKLLHGYQMDRITIWLNPGSDALGKGYNIIQSLIAFASGGFVGSGYGSSIQKLAYLPECHTDFIFAIIAEEFGFLGCLFIVCLFAAFVYRGMKIARRCPDMYGKLLAIGITFIFGFQAFLNMAVASSFFPVTGVTLPFISYGGTSIIVSLAMVGILLNISRQKVIKIRTNINE